MKKIIYLIFYLCYCIFFSAELFAGLTLQIEIVHKKGIDKGLVLISELHAIEDLAGRKEVRLRMKNGITLFLKAFPIQLHDDYGPSSKVIVSGDIFNAQGKKVKTLDKAKIIIGLGESRVITYQDQKQDQILEIKVLPFMQ